MAPARPNHPWLADTVFDGGRAAAGDLLDASMFDAKMSVAGNVFTFIGTGPSAAFDASGFVLRHAHPGNFRPGERSGIMRGRGA